MHPKTDGNLDGNAFSREFSNLPEKVKQKMPRRVLEELKSKLRNNDWRSVQNSLQSMDIRQDTPSVGTRSNVPLRMFGDTLIRGGKSKSLENLTIDVVSTDPRGNEKPSVVRLPRIELSHPYGQRLASSFQTDELRKLMLDRGSSNHINL
ncbi:hypothetical protein KIN20_014240 [Parelaphostrongylus tenuis]|uniref:Uncharacterized protein n=1 Tax=Parelaphostrongylus tenuis TaxID=148309 RepID=A0AAD5MI18_PARTN|nr:hypothetical protein KIN20_014240 [Parelaphostrongylus tenuis]